MKFPGAKRRPPFVTLPRHKRSHEVIRLKGKMRRDAAQYGGRFTSRLVLNEPGRLDLYNQWFDFYFPGTDRFTIWNASFVTARKAFWDKAHDIAHTRVAAMLTPEEREENSIWGDFEMYCEPQGAFFPMDERAASLIVLHEFVEPFGCNGSTAYGDHLFEYMRRA